MTDTTTSPTRIVVVTGCCGRIGRAICNVLAAEPDTHVRGYDRNPRPAELSAAVEHTQADLGDLNALTTCFAGSHAVVHCAACPDDADFERVLLPVNIAAVAHVLAACKAEPSIGQVIIASSGKVHCGHNNDDLPITVKSVPTPVCNYGASKLFAEGAAQAFAHATGTPTICIRFAWCPRTAEDVAAMRALTGSGVGADEYLSPSDAGRCVAAALRVDRAAIAAANPGGARAPYALLFCQSNPTEGGAFRFDLASTTALLGGWTPRDTFPAGIDEICASGDYIPNPELFARDPNFCR